jgi:hypothetical protein
MGATLDAMALAAAFGAFWALVLGALLALRLHADGGQRHRSFRLRS